MPERFISEAIKPVTEIADTSRMAIGEPGLPTEFVWRGRAITVTAVLRTWRETGKCRHGSPEMYVRKHWYEVALTILKTVMSWFIRRQLMTTGYVSVAMRRCFWWLGILPINPVWAAINDTKGVGRGVGVGKSVWLGHFLTKLTDRRGFGLKRKTVKTLLWGLK